MSSRRPSPAVPQKRAIAIKRIDGEPLTRADIQYDLLDNIFHDSHNVFTDPYPSDDTPSTKLCFRDLYIKTILNSPKATKALKDKMIDSSAFAEDFGMLSLLVNVGRVNTTMSFFPEMKTAIRTYHPVPALQRTTGNLQDAPRIKHILKSAILRNEAGATPSTPADVLTRVQEGHTPPTTVTNLIFVLANHSVPIGHQHFAGNMDFVDLFLRENVSSASRAQAFLWLCYHYLESPSTSNEEDYDNEGPANPFVDNRRGDAPSFTFLPESGVTEENIDPEEEKALGIKLVAQRTEILKAQGAKESNKVGEKRSTAASAAGGDDGEAMEVVDEVKPPKGKRTTTRSKASTAPKEKKGTATVSRRQVKEEKTKEREQYPVLALETDAEDDFGDQRISRNQYPHNHEARPHSELPSRLYRRASSGTPEPFNPRDQRRYSPYHKTSGSLPKTMGRSHRSQQSNRPSLAPRSLLQQAWHVITTTDPIIDSDEEIGDEQARQDYIQRLHIINMVRRKEPTPEPERTQIRG